MAVARHAGFALAIAASSVAVAPTLRDPPFWDALGCYVPLGRFVAAHGFDLARYRGLPFFRPPLLLGLFAAIFRGGGSNAALHIAIWMFAALLVLTSFVTARQLAATPATATLAAALCLLSPLFVAQAGLLQSDLPCAALVGLAWSFALARRYLAFGITAALAILTKESAHVLLLPATVLWVSDVPKGQRLWRAAAGLWPYLVLVGWVAAQRALLGRLLSTDQAAQLGIGGFFLASHHNYVEGGRLLLSLLMLPTLRDAWCRRSHDPVARACLATFGLVALLPFAFPAALPRYMLVSLPAHAALAALGAGRLPRAWRRLVPLAPLLLVAHWWAPTLDTGSDWHLESNLRYRRLLGIERALVLEVERRRPERVLTAFPIDNALSAERDGWVTHAVHTTAARPDMPLFELCAHSLLVASEAPALLRIEQRMRDANALHPAGQWTAWGHELRLFEIHCRH